MRSHAFREIQTDDGSTTLFCEGYGEACHSMVGAQIETHAIYVEGCSVVERATRISPFRILEIGFGTGRGYLATRQALTRAQISSTLEYVALEINPDIVEWAKAHSPYPFHVDVIVGNARDTIETLSGRSFHAFYQDAFSPKNNPELWTIEWFRTLRSLAAPDAILTTYCASSAARKSMLEAGWSIYPGPHVGKKNASTLARPSGESDSALLTHLARSPLPAITDATIDEYVQSQRR